MRFSSIFVTLLSISSISALPPTEQYNSRIRRGQDVDAFDSSLSNILDSRDLEKRRGGGGGKGGGGGGKGSGSGGKTGGSSGRPISSYSFSGQSNLGGRTRDGSGSPVSYGGRYPGGAIVPYTSGQRSPTRGVTPFLFPVAALGFFPGLWLYGAYAYPYGYGYYWNENGRNRTANVTCLCQEYSVCGCDDDRTNSTSRNILAQQLTDGSGMGAPVNSSKVRVLNYGPDNTTAYINGTLDNGTTASGGTDPSSEDQISAAAALVMNYGGYWAAAFVATLFITVA